MKQVIHIFGASGAGTSTLGKKICDELGYFFMDTDDYFWEPTDPKYTVKRSFEERLRLMKEDIEKHDQIVISGSLVDWGDELIPLFTLAIRLVTDTDVRIERLRKREKAKHDEWQKLLSCKRIVMDGAGDLDANFQCVKRELDRKESAPVMPYYRVHTSDIAYMTQQPRGIFTAVWKLVENKTLTEEEEKEYWKNREYFEEVLPVPPFYEQGNPDNATTWFKNAEAGNDIWKQMAFYRDMCKKYGVRLYLSECEELPGELVYEDAFQIGIKNTRPDLTVVTQVLK
ncbi:MAG TPA: hypothetical protein DEO39_06515 [Clostridiales bacterium]|nr:hypothetical protein [Clostridiales bacterium]